MRKEQCIMLAGSRNMPVHDWTNVRPEIFLAFHHGWVSELSRAMNRDLSEFVRRKDMTTSLDLSEKEISELKNLTKEDDLSAALRTALSEFFRYAKRMRLKELSDKVEMLDNWKELENLEMSSQ